jgi:hypothetical protein
VTATTGLGALFIFLDRLDELNVSYRLERVRDDTIGVMVRVPGEVWEVEFFADSEVEVERFRSTGQLSGPESLEELFRLAE